MTRTSRAFPANPRHESYGICAYCQKERGVNKDHVVPKSLVKKVGKANVPVDLRATVPACYACNIRKGARRLVPARWAGRIPELTELFPGTPWRVWHGGTDEPAYRETWTNVAELSR